MALSFTLILEGLFWGIFRPIRSIRINQHDFKTGKIYTTLYTYITKKRQPPGINALRLSEPILWW